MKIKGYRRKCISVVVFMFNIIMGVFIANKLYHKALEDYNPPPGYINMDYQFEQNGKIVSTLKDLQIAELSERQAYIIVRYFTDIYTWNYGGEWVRVEPGYIGWMTPTALKKYYVFGNLDKEGVLNTTFMLLDKATGKIYETNKYREEPLGWEVTNGVSEIETISLDAPTPFIPPCISYKEQVRESGRGE